MSAVDSRYNGGGVGQWDSDDTAFPYEVKKQSATKETLFRVYLFFSIFREIEKSDLYVTNRSR